MIFKNTDLTTTFIYAKLYKTISDYFAFKKKVKKRLSKLNNVSDLAREIKKYILAKKFNKKKQYGVITNKQFSLTIEPIDSFQKIIIILQQETNKFCCDLKLDSSVLYTVVKGVFNI
jgi:hypothetical protein